MTGSTVGQYGVLEKIGEGGMGEVYRAKDVLTGRVVALKMLRHDLAGNPEIVERYRAEAQSLGRLNHPNIAALYNFFVHQGNYFMAMEYVPGQTLEQLLKQCGPFPLATALGYLRQTLDALAHAHEQGILHRDIKPANLMVTGAGVIKVMDFGIARMAGGAALTRRGSILGTFEYMAPERLQGQPSDHRSDLYSAGVVLHELITGHLPFERSTEADLIRAHVFEPPPPASARVVGVPVYVEALLQKGLAKKPGDRYQTAREFSDAIASMETAEPVPVVRGARLPFAPAKLVAAAAVVVLVVLLVVLGGRVWSGGTGPEAVPPPAADAGQPKPEPKIDPARQEPEWRKNAVPVDAPIDLGNLEKDREKRRKDALRALGVEDEAR